jgi:hypothetical protein
MNAASTPYDPGLTRAGCDRVGLIQQAGQVSSHAWAVRDNY